MKINGLLPLSAIALLLLSCGASAPGTPNGTGGGAASTGGSGGGPTGSGGSTSPGSGGSSAGGSSGGASGGAGSGGAPGSGGAASGSGGTSSGGSGSGGAAPGSGGAGGLASGGRGSGGAGGAMAGGAGGGGRGGGGGVAATGCDWTNPEGRTVLFDGTSLAAWQNTTTGGAAQWRLVGDGTMEVVPMNSTNIQTSMKFEDLCLHLEYMTPMYAASVTGQARGNSGIYFKRSYEMQVLDTAGQPPAIDGCGAVYMVSPPLVVACNPQLVWNTYEIEFRASQWDASGKKTKNAAFVVARLNGQVVQQNVDLKVTMTTAGQPDTAGPAPLMLQDHGNPVRYRNIWVKIPR